MTNVIIGGCSFTYNSEMTWVDKIRELYKVRNVASCAAGQDYISRAVLEELVNLRYKNSYKNIIVIIQWSGIHRRAFLVNNCKDYYVDGTASPYVTKKNEFGYWIKNGGNTIDNNVSGSQMAEKHLFEPYRKIYNETQGAIESLEHIARTQWFCKLHNIPMFMFWWKDELKNFRLKNQHWDMINWNDFWFHKKTGGMAEWITDTMWDPGFSDGNHPTKEQHDKFSEKIILPWLNKVIHKVTQQ